jgi:hypothetical protein
MTEGIERLAFWIERTAKIINPKENRILYLPNTNGNCLSGRSQAGTNQGRGHQLNEITPQCDQNLRSCR